MKAHSLFYAVMTLTHVCLDSLHLATAPLTWLLLFFAEPESSASKDASKDSSNKLAGSASQKVDAESRVHEWQQQSGVDVDHRPPWGTFIKVGLSGRWTHSMATEHLHKGRQSKQGSNP